MTAIRQLIDQRIVATGDTRPGQWNLVADILQMIAREAQGWTNRADDAIRIPDMIYELSDHCRQTAQNPTDRDWTVDPDTNRCNSSEQYRYLVDQIEQTILNSANDIVRGRTKTVAGLILATLAHTHGLAPQS